MPPLTYVSAPTPEGVESTLKILVNDVRWHEADSIFGLGPTDRKFVTRAGDDEVTTAVFGNGEQGARLPTGTANVRAEYRQGIGKSGNVRAGQISQLTMFPLGVRSAVNPLRASGGADSETRDQARKNAPTPLMALDRLVSTQDYADFARTFAGVGKAFAIRLSDGRRELVHVTIAGADDAPIDTNSDVFRNLRDALRRFGDPATPIALAVRELMALVISAKVRLLPDYVWEKVEPKIRASLRDAFSFERRELGQDALRSEAIGAAQSVEGVAYVDVDVFGGVPEKLPDAQGGRRLLTPSEISAISLQFADLSREAAGVPEALGALARSISDGARVVVNLPELGEKGIRPAQLAYLPPDAPDAPDTLFLKLI
jgi:predicted phage baseplate assembly protein